MSEEEQDQTQDQSQDQNQDQSQDQEFDYEAAAKDMGWDPEYEGPGKRSAKEFYERGMEIQPILQKNLERFRTDNQQLKAQLDKQQKEFKKSIEVLNKHHKQQMEAKLAEIDAQKKEAVANADKDRYEQLEKQETQIRESQPDDPTPEVPEVMDDPEVKEWERRNPWVNNDPEASSYAQFYAQWLNNTQSHLSRTEFLDAVEKGVKEKFPEKFQNKRRNNPGVAEPKPSASKKKGKSFDDLPQEAKQAYEEINQTPGVEMSKEKYAKEYFELEDV